MNLASKEGGVVHQNELALISMYMHSWALKSS
jgi:hypothetical protein